jgi:type I restriction enzyme, S subunit
VLSLAIRGALTNQDPTEETGQHLLRRLSGGQPNRKSSNEKLTELPFSIPETWSKSELGWLLQEERGVSYGIIKLGSEPLKDGVKVLRCSNVRYRRIDLTGLRRVTEELSEEYGRTILQGGELLINVRGTLGGCAVVPSELRGFNIAREVAVIPIHPELDPNYLLCVVSSPYFQDKIDASLRGIAYRGLNLGLLREFLIPVPPLDEQARIVEVTNRLIEKIETLDRLRNESAKAGEDFAIAAVTKITGTSAKNYEPMKTPKTELVSNLKIAKKSKVKDEAPLACILQKQKGELSAKALWQQSGLEIDAFYQQLRTEIAAGWIAEPNSEDAYMKELTTT